MKYKVNKEKCIGCQVCIANCPGATKIGEDGKAEVIDQEKLEKCGGESVCPLGAIEKKESE
jgi:ferredoxin